MHQKLECIGGSFGCKSETPDKITCTNAGIDSGNIIWDCKGNLPKYSILGLMSFNYCFLLFTKLFYYTALFFQGETIVSCEGYSSSNDPFILKNSCGVCDKYFLFLFKFNTSVL